MVGRCGQFRPVKPVLRKVLGGKRLCLKLPKRLRCDSGKRTAPHSTAWPFLATLQQAATAGESCWGPAERGRAYNSTQCRIRVECSCLADRQDSFALPCPSFVTQQRGRAGRARGLGRGCVGGGRDEWLMRLIDSGSGIGHPYDAVTNPGPVYMCSRALRHLSAPPLRAGRWDSRKCRPSAGEKQQSTARHSAWAWRRCG